MPGQSWERRRGRAGAGPQGAGRALRGWGAVRDGSAGCEPARRCHTDGNAAGLERQGKKGREGWRSGAVRAWGIGRAAGPPACGARAPVGAGAAHGRCRITHLQSTTQNGGFTVCSSRLAQRGSGGANGGSGEKPAPATVGCCSAVQIGVQVQRAACCLRVPGLRAWLLGFLLPDTFWGCFVSAARRRRRRRRRQRRRGGAIHTPRRAAGRLPPARPRSAGRRQGRARRPRPRSSLSAAAAAPA
jgi:hypothetical protein